MVAGLNTAPSEPASGSEVRLTVVRAENASSARGVLRVLARGDRLDVFGDFGIVLTAYAQSAPTVELACAAVPKSNNARTPTAIQFNVTDGETYRIEVSATGNATLVVTAGAPSPTVSITALALTVALGGGQQQFLAQVANADDEGVRWPVTPPIGVISPAGVYTPPLALTDPVNVTITATSFANPSQSARMRLVCSQSEKQGTVRARIRSAGLSQVSSSTNHCAAR
jgi:hypothetical protein